MKDLENFLQAVQDKIGQAKFSERLKAIDDALAGDIRYSSRTPDDNLFFYIAICTAPYRGKTTSYIATEYSRIYPMLLNLNKKWIYTREIKNFENKFDELCAEKPSQSVDSFFFEILVAISYVEQGYFVEFIEKISKKTPDIRISKNSITRYVECKKLQRANAFSYEELDAWYRLIDEISQAIYPSTLCGQIHFKFKTPIKNININTIKSMLTQKTNYNTIFEIVNNDSINIIFKPFKKGTLFTELDPLRHISSPSLIHFLTGEYNYRFFYRSCMLEAQICGGYVEKIKRAIIFSCQLEYNEFPASRAQHIKRRLVEASEQITSSQPGSVHILIEECHNEFTYQERNQKNMKVIHDFIDNNKGIEHIFIHYIKYVTPPDKQFDVEETVQCFRRIDIPPVEMPPMWYPVTKYSDGYGTLLTDY